MALLIHSLAELAPLLLGLVDRLDPSALLEIGSETGGFSKQLYDSCMRRSGSMITVEPFPAPSLVRIAEASSSYHLFIGKSIPYLLQEGCPADMVFIDGDHNWFTVFTELTLIDDAWKKAKRTGVIVMHDVGWPCARRDSYYDPKALPPEAVRPFTFAHGVTLDDPGVISGGFRGEGSFAWAKQEGGACNGVLTAIEDFLAEHAEYNYRSVDAVFGFGFLTLKNTEQDAIVAEMLKPYENPLLARLERNRLELYLNVIELQDAMARAA